MDKGAALALTVVVLGFVAAVAIFGAQSAKKQQDAVVSTANEKANGIWDQITN